MSCFKCKDNGEIRPNAHNNARISSSNINNIIHEPQIISLENRIAQVFIDSRMNLLHLNNTNTIIQNINNNGVEQSENQESVKDNFIIEKQTSDNLLFNNSDASDMKPE